MAITAFAAPLERALHELVDIAIIGCPQSVDGEPEPMSDIKQVDGSL
ncbi:hypothetical protein [Sphingomonas sp. BK235]|nr:hypothetical protein [Sphingomonas sp. BK235]